MPSLTKMLEEIASGKVENFAESSEFDVERQTQTTSFNLMLLNHIEHVEKAVYINFKGNAQLLTLIFIH